MDFRHERIDDDPPCGRLGICRTTDLTGNGRQDVIVGGLGDPWLVQLPFIGKRLNLRHLPVTRQAIAQLQPNIFWYENPGWTRHRLSTTARYVFGNALGDVNGNGRLDLLVGQGIGRRNVYWLEQPADPRESWEMHLVAADFEKYHDLAFGDVDNDGEPELIGLSQESETVFYYDIPEDPYREPWPPECLHVIATDVNIEGLEIVDIDSDGRREVIAGTSVFRQEDSVAADPVSKRVVADGTGAGKTSDGWVREEITTGWDWTRVAVADLDADGDLEVVFTEGDSPLLGTRPGRVGWFDPPDWKPHILRDDMYCPHTVQVADFDGSGRPDIYVAEMGHGGHDDPEHVIFRNCGDEFEEERVAHGIPTHEAKAADLTGNGRPDIVGKSYGSPAHVDVWYNES